MDPIAAAEVDRQWTWLTAYAAEVGLAEVVAGARERHDLAILFPFLSVERLRFSRTTRFPYTLDAPMVEKLQPGLYRASTHEGQTLAEGPLKVVLDAVIEHLPRRGQAAEAREAREDELPSGRPEE